MDFTPCIYRAPFAEKSVNLVDRSAIDADLCAREFAGRTNKGAANRFSVMIAIPKITQRKTRLILLVKRPPLKSRRGGMVVVRF